MECWLAPDFNRTLDGSQHWVWGEADGEADYEGAAPHGEKVPPKGDSVVNLTGWPSGITTIKNTSRSNFAVIVYSQEGDYLDLLVNEIGAYSGEVLLPEADPMVLVIQDVGGTWSFSAVQQ